MVGKFSFYVSIPSYSICYMLSVNGKDVADSSLSVIKPRRTSVMFRVHDVPMFMMQIVMHLEGPIIKLWNYYFKMHSVCSYTEGSIKTTDVLATCSSFWADEVGGCCSNLLYSCFNNGGFCEDRVTGSEQLSQALKIPTLKWSGAEFSNVWVGNSRLNRAQHRIRVLGWKTTYHDGEVGKAAPDRACWRNILLQSSL